MFHQPWRTRRAVESKPEGNHQYVLIPRKGRGVWYLGYLHRRNFTVIDKPTYHHIIYQILLTTLPTKVLFIYKQVMSCKEPVT